VRDLQKNESASIRNQSKEGGIYMSQFIKVRCAKCKNEQVIFSNSSNIITCLVCDKEVATPTGGKSKIIARVLEVLE
jgi:small subunit ribosomal protein S27e